MTSPENERAYIKALVERYSDDPRTDRRTLAREYSKAMGELSRRYPDDLDAATLYAESLMDIHPWKLWSPNGLPLEDTEEIINILESVLRRDPNHIGANHYYVHAMEGSPQPGRALSSAHRLETAAPSAGHLIHMPSHIYIRIGDYSSAARSNVSAAEVDRTYLDRIAGWGMSYDAMYYCHDLQFLAAAYSMAGRFAAADHAAHELVMHAYPLTSRMPELEVYLPTELFVLLRFNRWEEVLKLPKPEPELVMSTAFWHFGRGVARAAKGQRTQADAEHEALEAAHSEIGESVQFGGYFNKARSLLGLANYVLDARIAMAKGDRNIAIEYWHRAVDMEDALSYSEPPDWYYPVRESLGAALLVAGRASEAESIFRADLERNPRNPRSLLGLWKSLLVQKKSGAAGQVRREFEAACKDADVQLRVDDL